MESTLNIESWPIENVQPYDKNPRLNEKAIEPVARSLREFGFRQPLVVDADGVLIVGHTRLLAAKSLGMTEVPVHVAATGAGVPTGLRVRSNDRETAGERDQADRVPASRPAGDESA